MRLHLPKTLLAAVLAACAALPTWADTQYGWKEGAPAVSTDGGANWKNISYTPGGTVGSDGVGVETVINNVSYYSLTTPTVESAYEYQSAQNVTAISAEGKDVKITASASKDFLRSGTSIGNSLYLTGNRFENGTDNLGNLNDITDENGNKTAGFTNVYIVGAQIYAQSDSDKTLTSNYFLGAGTNNGTLRLDGAGTVTFSGQTTLVGNATIHKEGGNKGNAQAIFNHLNLNGFTLTANAGKDLVIKDVTGSGALALTGGDSSDASTIQIAGSNNIGTLTLNGAFSTGFTLVGTNTDTTTITSLVTSGSVLDASGMEGILTISGATWTGDLTTASVEVVRAKDASTAMELATSMNTTHGLNYSFSASENSVCREVRTTSEFTATTDGAEKPRIVIGNIIYAGKTFSNVGMSDLLAGDKVTINGLTGWIGQNGANTILADLKFTGENHINDGSSTNNWITYSGAITGDGTLSYEWDTKAYTYNFNGDLSGFTGTISDTTTLNVTIGGTLADGVSNAVRATIDIAGNLTVNRETTFTEGFTANQLKGNQKIVFDGAQTINCTQDGDFSGNIDVKSGKLTVKGLVKTTGDFDLCGPSATNRYSGTVEVASQGRLTLAGNNIWGLANSAKILLQENGSLKWSDLLITGKAAIADVETGLTIGETQALNTEQSLNTLRNSTVTYTGTGTKTLSWTLDGCGVNVSTGTLTVNGTNTDTALNVSGGTALFDSSLSTSLADSTVSGGIVKLKGYYTTLNGTLNISGGTVINTAVGTKDPDTVNEIEAPLKLGQGGKVVISGGGSLENDGFTYTKTDTASTAGTNDASLALTNNATSGSLKVFGGDLEITNATMTKTETNSKGIGIALNNVTLVLGQNTGITTLQMDGKTGRTQNLSGVSVASGATLKVANSNATLGDVSGAGTVSTSVDNEFSLAGVNGGTGSSFSGTLEATAGTLKVTGVGEQTMGEYTMPHWMTALKASGGGELSVMETPLVSITEMVIGAGSTVGVYIGSAQEEAQEGSVSMHGTSGDNARKCSLTIESGATLNANLQLTNTTLTFNGTLTMGSDLTLSSGNELAGALYNTWDKQSDLTLFTSVDNLYIGSEAATVDTEYDASSVFSNIGDGYSLKMTGTTDNYSVMLVQSSDPTPEPTTATLSLLALMGLAARRRRKA